MRAECIDAVEQAIGRNITQAERVGIEARVSAAMRQEAKGNPAAFRAMGKDARLAQAADRAANELVAEAIKKRQRVARQILAVQRLEVRKADAKAAGKSQARGLFDALEQVDRDRKGIERDAFGSLVEALDAVHSRYLGLVEDPRTARAFIQEIFGVDSGSAIAKKGAQAWIDVSESLRARFNDAGGDVGKLGYGYIPQPHDGAAVLKAGQDAWVQDTLPLLDRSQYARPDGTMMDDADLTEFLRNAWETISTDGANKIEPGKATSGGMLAKRHGAHRAIHFAGPDQYLAYMNQYGKRGVMASMQSHIGAMARDIAMVENLGPNPRAAFKVARDGLLKDGASTRVFGGLFDVQSAFEQASGTYDHPASATMASVAQGARNLQVASKLGGAVLSSVTDMATLAVTSGFHRLPAWDVASNLVRSFGSESAEFANRAGLMADSIISDMNRWAEGNIGPGYTSKLANATMKLSLMNAWTDSTRRAFGLSLMGSLGKLTRQPWSALDDVARARFERAGITGKLWSVYQSAQPEDWRGSMMLTKQAVQAVQGIDEALRRQAVTRLLGFITDESEYAVVNPDLATRVMQSGSTQKGTATGELWRSMMLFKSFPISMLTRHWQRAFTDSTMSGGGRLAYGTALMAGLMGLGYVAMSLKDIAKGKDPRDVTDPRTWGAAFMQGGGAGIFGDFLFQDTSRFGNSFTATAAGPIASTVESAMQLTVGNLHQAARGKDTKAAAEALRFIKANTPLANLWYSAAAIDRAFLHQLQEMASPGYLRRMERRAKQDAGQSYWWRPGQRVPSRAPDFAGMVGQ